MLICISINWNILIESNEKRFLPEGGCKRECEVPREQYNVKREYLENNSKVKDRKENI